MTLLPAGVKVHRIPPPKLTITHIFWDALSGKT